MLTVDRRFRRVSSGLRQIYAGFLLTVLALLGAIAILLLRERDAVLNWAVLGLSILGQVLGIIGQFGCLDVPAKVKATGAITGSVGLSVGSVVLSVAAAIPSLGAPEWAGGLASLLSLGGSLLFLVFLGRLAEFLGDPKQVARAKFVLNGTVGLLALVFVLGFLSRGPRNRGGDVMAAAAGLGLAAFGLVLLARYAILLVVLRQELDRLLFGRTFE